MESRSAAECKTFTSEQFGCVGEVLHIGLKERHTGQRLIVNPHEIDSDITFMVGGSPAIDSNTKLKFRLFVLGNGIQTRAAVVTQSLCKRFQAFLLVELKLNGSFNQPESDILSTHLFGSKAKLVRIAQNLLPVKDNLRDRVAVKAIEDGENVLSRAFRVITWSGKDIKSVILGDLQLK